MANEENDATQYFGTRFVVPDLRHSPRFCGESFLILSSVCSAFTTKDPILLTPTIRSVL